MPKDHLKRISAPKSWPMQRKLRTFVTRPNPGRSFTLATSLNQVMKLMIKKGKTTKEVRYILNHSEVLVNGTRVYDHRRPVGLMDIVSFPETKENFMITLSRKGKLKAIEVDAKQADSRLLKIQNKTRKSGKIQVNFSDGTNLLVDKDTYKTGDSVLYSKGKVSKHLPLKEGMTILLTGGSHLAKTGSVKAVEGRTIVFENADGEHSTAKRHALVVGEKSPEVTIQ